MHKLEAVSLAPQAMAVLSIQSVGDAASVVLTVNDAWKPSEDDWVRDDSKRKQSISYMAEGRTLELVGAVPEPDAVEIAGAWKVVAIVRLALHKQSGQNRLQVARVVEVWSAPGKCLWRAKDWQDGSSKSPASFDPASGRINKAA